MFVSCSFVFFSFSSWSFATISPMVASSWLPLVMFLTVRLFYQQKRVYLGIENCSWGLTSYGKTTGKSDKGEELILQKWQLRSGCFEKSTGKKQDDFSWSCEGS